MLVARDGRLFSFKPTDLQLIFNITLVDVGHFQFRIDSDSHNWCIA